MPKVGSTKRPSVSALPATWTDGLRSFEASSFLRELFGERFVSVYSELKRQEIDEFDRYVSPLEYHSYL